MDTRPRWAAPGVLSPRGGALLVIGVALLVHGLGLANRFAGDDLLTIAGHPAIGGGQGLRALLITDALGLPIGDTGTLYRPVTSLSYLIDWRLAGGAPWVFHLTSLLLFLVLCLLVQRLARRWLDERGALLAALLFAAFPIHVEAVANPTGRSDILSLLFGLLALSLAVPGGPPQRPGTADTCPPTWRAGVHIGGAAGLYTLSLLSKEACILFPAVAAWLTYSRGSARRRDYVPALAMTLVAGAFLAFRRHYLRSTTDLAAGGFYAVQLYNPLASSGVTPGQRLWSSMEVLGRYLVLSLVPYEMPIDYSFAASIAHMDLSSPLGWIGAAALIGTGAGAGYGLLRRNRASALLGAFAGSYLPVANLLVLIGTIQAHRLFFGPSLWVALLLGLLWERYGALIRRRVAVAGLLLLLAIYAATGIVATRCWRDDESRAVCSMETRPESVNSQRWLSYAYWRHGATYESIWYMALSHATIAHFPRRWAPDPALDRLPFEQRVDRMTELLDMKMSHEQHLIALERYVREDLGSQAMSRFIREHLMKRDGPGPSRR